MQLPDITKITIDKVDDPVLHAKSISLDVLRLDKIHPVISGNKWFKLKYHLDNYNAGNYKGILTLGGAWSNHIVATACTCCLLKIKCIGVIRGEKPPQLSPTLLHAIEYGMELRFISREHYKQKNYSLVQEEFTDYYVIPEGGSGDIGEKGAGEIMHLVPENYYTHIACAIGTGTMFNGLKKMAANDQVIIGVAVLKGWPGVTDPEENIVTKEKLIYNYHFGGYAKHTPELLSFMNDFYMQSNIPTDFVYTGKLVYAIYDLIKKDRFPATSTILIIHSGGLQGNTSLQKGSLMF